MHKKQKHSHDLSLYLEKVKMVSSYQMMMKYLPVPQWLWRLLSSDY